jgi:hypothetical protein
MQWSISLGANKPEVLQKTERTIWKAILNIVNQPGDYLSIMNDLSLEFNLSYVLELEKHPETMAGWFNIRKSDQHENSLAGGEAGVNTRGLIRENLTGNNMNVGVAGGPDDTRGAIQGNQEADGNTGGPCNREADGNTGGAIPGNLEEVGSTGGPGNQKADGNTGGGIPGNQEEVGNTGGAIPGNQKADGNTGDPDNREADGNTGDPGNREADGNTGGAIPGNLEEVGNTGGPGNREADGNTEKDHGIDRDEPRRSSRANRSIESKSLSKK